MFGRGIDRANRTIGKTDIGVRHNGLRFSGRKVIAMRHAHRRIFMRHDQSIGKIDILCCGFGQTFDDRRKVGAGIGKDIINPDRLHAGQNRPAGGQGNLTGFVTRVVCHLTPLVLLFQYFYI